jgi:predicted O-methyltransferase YrrM
MYSATRLAKKYFRYYISASNRKGHGIHSPFVFDFIKFVKNDKLHYTCYYEIEKLRKNLLADKSIIEVEDFGAGSAVIKTNKRAVYKMAQSSLKPKRFAQLLFRMVQHYQPKTIVEFGTSFGITSAYLAFGYPDAKLYTLEGARSIAAIARKNFHDLGLHNVEIIEGDFSKTMPELFGSVHTVDLAFIDGNHRREPTLEYFEKLLQYSTTSTILIFDDIHWSTEMEEAWEQIKAHESVTLSIDLFFIGIIFLRKEFKQKQHFRIRF